VTERSQVRATVSASCSHTHRQVSLSPSSIWYQSQGIEGLQVESRVARCLEMDRTVRKAKRPPGKKN